LTDGGGVAGDDASEGDASTHDTGTVEVHLTFPVGVMPTGLDYVITGPSSMTTVAANGAIVFSNTTMLTFSRSLPAGSGYMITVRASAPHSSLACTASSSAFAVDAGATTAVSMTVTCM
jgi:hypothetical protein